MSDVPHTTTTIGCVDISIQNSITWWTAQQVYDLLAAEAPDLNTLLGLNLELFVNVRDDDTYRYQSGVDGHLFPAGCSVGSNYSACTNVDTMTLIAALDRNQFVPPQYECCHENLENRIPAHEFGHVWFEYFKWLAHGGSYADYLAQRNLVPGSYAATVYWEVAAEDYRLCFGTALARGTGQSAPGNDPPSPAQCAFLANTWRA